MRGIDHARVALVFGFGGLASGINYVILTSSSLGRFFIPPQPLPHLPLFLLWPGGLFLVAMGLSLAICQNLRWINIRVSWGRFIAASLLLVLASFCGALAGLLSGLATAVLLAEPVLMRAGRLVRPPHSAIHEAIPVVAGLLFGLLVSAMLISLAAFAVTEELDVTAWRWMLLCVAVIVAATFAAHPAFFGIAGSVGARENYLDVFENTVLSLHLWGYTLYGACAGYWLAAVSGKTRLT